MEIIIDILTIIIATFFVCHSYRRIIYGRRASIGNFVMIIVYVFCITPIILNYIMGKPSYESLYWYKPFIEPMNTASVNVIYDICILTSQTMLYFYIKKTEKKEYLIRYEASDNVQITLFNSKIVTILSILSPVIYIIISGTWKNYLVYTTTTLRGFTESNYSVIMNSLILLSMFAFYNTIFRKKITIKKTVVTVIFSVVIIWLSGKRFMIANIFLMILFYINYSEISQKTRNIIAKIIPIVAVLILVFSAVYLVYIKPLSDTSTQNVYEMLRVDFGRDDVTKYVIFKDLIKGERILDYRGQSFLGTFLTFIPRAIWPNKPYPHYRYLTASILELDIFNLPAGTTPSWYEMCIANFGTIGILIACILLVAFCKIADSEKRLELKSIYLLLLSALLTQSIDAYIIYVLILIVCKGVNIIFNKKDVKFVWRNDVKD